MEAKMASIYGFSLKNRKTFQGLDWQNYTKFLKLKVLIYEQIIDKNI